MNRTSFLLIVLIGLNSLSIAAPERELTIEEIFRSGKFREQRLDSPSWLPDSKSFIFLKYDSQNTVPSFYRHDVESGEERLWLDGASLIHPQSKDTLRFFDYHLSPSAGKIIFKTDAKRVWRRFDEGRFFIYDIAKKTLQPVYQSKERIRHIGLSPDEEKVAYVLGNNIYFKDLNTGKTTRVTDDGSDVILNGLGDWVYEEEFGLSKAWAWSPDSRYIAFHRFDQSKMQTFSWTEFGPLHGEVKTVPYPKAGDPISSVRIGVYDIKNAKSTWMKLGKRENVYIPRIRWTNKENFLMIERMNRLQNRLEIMLGNALTGETEIAFTETDPSWISLTDDVFFLKNKEQFIRTSESDGFNHIYLYDMSSLKKVALTKGRWEVSKIYGVDKKNGIIYFQANKDRIENRQIYFVDINSKKVEQITAKPGTNSALFAPDYSFFLLNFSNVSTPRKTYLARRDGAILRTLVENKMEDLKDFSIAVPEFTFFTTSDGVEIRAMITKPADFDPYKKYPVLIYGYSGPASQLVRNVWGRTTSRLWYTLLTQKGYIIFTLDQRGTAGRGKAFKNLAYGDIGKYMLLDHIEGVKYLRSLPYVEGERIGVWGWSGGGYLTLMALSKGAEYFKAGVAVAPVSDFRLYDNIWTERYMGLPAENKAGYDSSSVLTYADRYQGGLLIIHGSSDDNVHLQHTMQFIEKLQIAGKPFEMMIYPGKNHSMLGKGNVYYHLYALMTKFITENL